MILCIDVGNSNTVIALAEGEDILDTWRIRTERDMTPDEFGIMSSLMLKGKRVTDIIISSVVPVLNHNIREACLRYHEKDPVIVTHDMNMGISISYEELDKLGTDRIVNAAGAYARYKKGVTIIDFGTATTFDYVSPEGVYMGGAISPGIRLSADALFEKAYKLPRIERFFLPERVLARNTIESINTGIVSGYAFLVDGMVQRIRSETGDKAQIVIATGGLAHLMKDVCRSIDIVDELLTLYGLTIIHRINKKEC